MNEHQVPPIHERLLLVCFINEEGVCSSDVEYARWFGWRNEEEKNNQLLDMRGFLLGCFIHVNLVCRS
jgi:hypothetical protein